MAAANYTLVGNVTGAITANYPVGYTLTMMLLTFVFVTFHYMYPISSMIKFMVGGDPIYDDPLKFSMVDFGLFTTIKAVILYGGFIWSFVNYYGRFLIDDPDSSGLLQVPIYNIPQEVTNIVVISIFLFQMIGHWAVLIKKDFFFATPTDLTRAMLPDRSDYADASKELVPNSALNYYRRIFPTYALSAVVLFWAIMGFVQTTYLPTVPYTYCSGGGATVCWGGAQGFWGTNIFILAIGITLAYYLMFRFSFINDPVKMKEYSKTAPALFASADGPELHNAMVLGTVPTFHLPGIWILAYIFYIPFAVTIIYHDLVKGAMAFSLWGLLPLLMALTAQDLGFFYPYHVACVVYSYIFMYFSDAVVYPPTGTALSGDQVVVDYGAFLTGPDTKARVNADVFTVSLWGLGTAVIALFCLLWHVAGLAQTKAAQGAKVASN
jgi:hypothetical protein